MCLVQYIRRRQYQSLAPMSHLIYLFPFLVMLFPLPASSADQTAGKYVSSAKNICFVGPPNSSGEITWTDCSSQRDELIIRKVSGQYSVELSFVFTNGHECTFAGAGKLNGRELVAVDPDNQDCSVTLSFKGKAVQISQADQCRPYYCGARGSISGTILHKFAGR